MIKKAIIITGNYDPTRNVKINYLKEYLKEKGQEFDTLICNDFEKINEELEKSEKNLIINSNIFIKIKDENLQVNKDFINKYNKLNKKYDIKLIVLFIGKNEEDGYRFVLNIKNIYKIHNVNLEVIIVEEDDTIVSITKKVLERTL